MIPEVKNPKYEVIDLAQFDEEYAGQVVRVMVNPSRAFRLGFIRAALNTASGEFIEYLATIIEGDEAAIADAIGNMPADAFQWLFAYTVYDRDGKPEVIAPHIVTMWDERIVARVKARAALPPASATPSASSEAAN